MTFFGLGGGEYGCSPIEQGISAGWLDCTENGWKISGSNIEPGLCNNYFYWIIGEVDKNNSIWNQMKTIIGLQYLLR